MINRSVGCIGLGGCASGIAVLVLIVGIIAGAFYLITGTFRSSPVYLDAIQAVQSDPQVVQSLGTPIQSGWLVTGSIEEQGLSGDASLVIPISGPRGSGSLYASAREGNGKWQFYTLAVQIDGHDQVIELR
jgi:Cytochrome oxidase complex assembly protein 1